MRIWNNLRNLLLCLLLALFLGALLGLIWDLPERFLGMQLAGALWGSCMGLWRWKREGPLPGLAFLFGVLLSAAIALKLLRPYVGAPFTGIVLLSATEVLCFRWTLRCQDCFYIPLGITTLLFALPVLLLWHHALWLPPASLALVLTLDGLRFRGLYQSHHMGITGALESQDPALIRSSTRLFAAVLALLCCVCPLVYLLGLGLTHLAKQLLRLLSGPLDQAYQWLAYWIEVFNLCFWSHFQEINISEGEHIKSSVSWHLNLPVPEALKLLPFLGLAALIGSIGLATYGIVRKKEKPPIPDYVDEIEALERPRWHLRQWNSSRKRQRLSDFTDNNLKIRFVFQKMLRHRVKSEPDVLFRTPNELANAQDPIENQLMNSYNRIRYGNKTATDQEVQSAADYLNAITRRF